MEQTDAAHTSGKQAGPSAPGTTHPQPPGDRAATKGTDRTEPPTDPDTESDAEFEPV